MDTISELVAAGFFFAAGLLAAVTAPDWSSRWRLSVAGGYGFVSEGNETAHAGDADPPHGRKREDGKAA